MGRNNQVFIEKYLGLSGEVQLKSMLFKGQLYCENPKSLPVTGPPLGARFPRL